MAHQIDKNLINISEIARRIGISQSYASELILGKKTGPKAQEHLRKMEAEIAKTRTKKAA